MGCGASGALGSSLPWGLGTPTPPRVVGEAGGRLTGGYCSSDDPKWREMERGKAQIDWQARGLKKDLRG